MYPASSFSAAIVAAVRSRVQIDEPSPNCDAFARSIASSRLPHRPDRERRAEHLLDGDLGVVRRLEDQRRLVEPAARELVAVGTLAAREQLAATRERGGHLLLERLPLRLGVQRADHRPLRRAGAERQLRDLALELLHELVGDPLVDVERA